MKPANLDQIERVIRDMPLPTRAKDLLRACALEIRHLRKQRDGLQSRCSDLYVRHQQARVEDVELLRLRVEMAEQPLAEHYSMDRDDFEPGGLVALAVADLERHEKHIAQLLHERHQKARKATDADGTDGRKYVVFHDPAKPQPVKLRADHVTLAPLVLGDQKFCPDGGKCTHDCDNECWRVATCAPLSNVFEDDNWPPHLRTQSVEVAPGAHMFPGAGGDFGPTGAGHREGVSPHPMGFSGPGPAQWRNEAGQLVEDDDVPEEDWPDR